MRGAAIVHPPRAAALAMNGGAGGYARGGAGESLGAPVDARRVDSLVADRNAYRRERRFDEADAVRAELRSMNVKLHDKEKMWVVGNSPPRGGRGPQQRGGYDDRGGGGRDGGRDGGPRQQRGGYDDRGPPQRGGYGDGGRGGGDSRGGDSRGGYGARDDGRGGYDRGPRSGAYGQGGNGQQGSGYERGPERSPSSYGRMADRYADSSPGTRYGNPRGDRGASGDRGGGGGERGGRYGGGGAAERGGSDTRGGRGGGSYGRDGGGYGREGVGYGGRDERGGGYDDRSADQRGHPNPEPNLNPNSSPNPNSNPNPITPAPTPTPTPALIPTLTYDDRGGGRDDGGYHVQKRRNAPQRQQPVGRDGERSGLNEFGHDYDRTAKDATPLDGAAIAEVNSIPLPSYHPQRHR